VTICIDPNSDNAKDPNNWRIRVLIAEARIVQSVHTFISGNQLSPEKFRTVPLSLTSDRQTARNFQKLENKKRRDSVVQLIAVFVARFSLTRRLAQRSSYKLLNFFFFSPSLSLSLSLSLSNFLTTRSTSLFFLPIPTYRLPRRCGNGTQDRFRWQ